MKTLWLMLAVVVAAVPVAGQVPAKVDVVAEVRAAIAAKDLDLADAIFTKRRAEQGERPEVLAALSWLGRGALAAGQLDRAERYSREAQRLAVAALGGRPLADENLATAIGAAIETQALVRVQRGERSEAIYGLERELATYKDTSIHKRLQKNINLLNLEGTTAPPLDNSEFIGSAPPTLAQLKGKVLVLFFWAHWCPDCKLQGPILSKLLAKYRQQGLAIVAPTQRYGYAAEGATATPAEELRHITKVRDTYYGFLADIPVPVSEANHKRYGVSSTPTLVIADQQGIVRLYRPGRMTEDELETRIRGLLGLSTSAARQ